MRHIPAVYLRCTSGGTPVRPGPRQGTAPPRAPARRHGVTCPGTRIEIASIRCRGIRTRRPAGLRSRAAARLRARDLSAAGRRAAARCEPGTPGPQPCPPARVHGRLHRRYTAGRREVHPSGPAGTASPRLRRRAGERETPGTPEGHRRYTAGPSQVNGTWLHGSGKIRDHEELTVHPYDDPFSPDGEDGTGDPHPPGLPEAAVTGPARWRLSPERSACWSPGRSRWPCGPAAWPRACRTGWCRWMS